MAKKFLFTLILGFFFCCLGRKSALAINCMQPPDPYAGICGYQIVDGTCDPNLTYECNPSSVYENSCDCSQCSSTECCQIDIPAGFPRTSCFSQTTTPPVPGVCGNESDPCCENASGHYCNAPWVPVENQLGTQCFCRQGAVTTCQVYAYDNKDKIIIELLGNLENTTYSIFGAGSMMGNLTTDDNKHAIGEYPGDQIPDNSIILARSQLWTDQCTVTYKKDAISISACGCLIEKISIPPLSINAPANNQAIIQSTPAPLPGCNSDCETCMKNGKAYTPFDCLPTNDPNKFAQWIMRFSLGIGGGIALIMAIFGGIGVITFGGDTKKLQASRERITAAVTGLLFIIFAVFFLEIVGTKILNLPGMIP